MEKIEGSAETLMRQASITSNDYFLKAIENIDNQFGEGYSKDNPELIGSFMVSSSNDYLAQAITSALQEISKKLSNSER